MLTTSDKTDTAALMTALRRLREPERNPARKFTPRPHTDIEYYAPCFKTSKPTIASKQCTRCEVIQDAEEFRYKADSRTETHSWCRTCEAEAQRKRNARRRGRAAA